jgi:hypothetical protein
VVKSTRRLVAASGESQVAQSSPSPPTPGARTRRVCFLSRSRGWIDPDDPHRPTSEVNLLAIATGAPVWSLGTAWKSIFHRLMPSSVEDAYRKAMVRARLSEAEVERLRTVAEHLRIDLVVRD